MDKFKKFYAVIITVLFIALALSCKTLDTPSVTNFFNSVEKLKTAYCSESLLHVREEILVKIHEHYPDYPAHGFCGYVLPEIIVDVPGAEVG